MTLPTFSYRLDPTILFARLFGFYLLIMVIAMIVRKDHFKHFVDEFLKSDAMVTLAGVFTLIFGLVLVIMHNIWSNNWQVIVTILCWWTLIKGCILLFYPAPYSSKARALMESPAPYNATIIFSLVISLFLLYMSFV